MSKLQKKKHQRDAWHSSALQNIPRTKCAHKFFSKTEKKQKIPRELEICAENEMLRKLAGAFVFQREHGMLNLHEIKEEKHGKPITLKPRVSARFIWIWYSDLVPLVKSIFIRWRCVNRVRSRIIALYRIHYFMDLLIPYYILSSNFMQQFFFIIFIKRLLPWARYESNFIFPEAIFNMKATKLHNSKSNLLFSLCHHLWTPFARQPLRNSLVRVNVGKLKEKLCQFE